MFPDKTRSSIIPTRADVIASARGWLDVPFRHQGRTRNGIDCVGVCIVTGKELGFVPVDYDNKNYPRRSPSGQDFLKYFRSCGFLVEKSNADKTPGDIVCLKEPFFPCHCGILGWKDGVLSLIHGYDPYKKVVEDYFDQGGWEEKLVATFEFKGIPPWHN